MIAIRYAPDVKEPGAKAAKKELFAPENARLVEVPPVAGESNAALLRRLGVEPGAILLIGGSTLEHFRIRVAQSHLRTDLLPSQWSIVGLIGADKLGFWSVPLGQDNVSVVPSHGGVRYCSFKQYDDPVLFPNVAVLRFKEDMRPFLDVL